jgi:hypothetical protein
MGLWYRKIFWEFTRHGTASQKAYTDLLECRFESLDANILSGISTNDFDFLDFDLKFSGCIYFYFEQFWANRI